LLCSRALRPQWFAQALQLVFVRGVTGEYVDFSTGQHAALLMLTQRVGGAVTDNETSAMVRQMTSPAAHPEVADALANLRRTPLRVVALTKSWL
jgi:2-haloacid dehalogenase